jgi:hypothetical protein
MQQQEGGKKKKKQKKKTKTAAIFDRINRIRQIGTICLSLEKGGKRKRTEYVLLLSHQVLKID